MKKALFIILGTFLIAVVIKLGLIAKGDPSYVIWFGLASALLVPSAFGLIGYALKSDERKLLSELSKVPQIDELIEKAKSQEEKIEILEKERNKLNEIIRLEAKRQTLFHQKSTIENTMVGLYKEYVAIIQELESINEEVEESPVLEEIKKIQKRLNERKDGGIIVVKFGKKEIVFKQKNFSDSPLDLLFWFLMKLIEDIQKKLNKKKKS